MRNLDFAPLYRATVGFDRIADLMDRVLTTDSLVRGENTFFAATGVTNGGMLRGVSYRANGATTRSLVVRSKSGISFPKRSRTSRMFDRIC